MRIFVTGGTGFIGKFLTDHLLSNNHEVTILTRSSAKAKTMFGDKVAVAEGDIKVEGSWMEAIKGQDAVVHLVGEPVVTRWTDSKKNALRASRIDSTNNLVKAIAAQSDKPRVLVSGSAIGYYGTDATKSFGENAEPGNDFLATMAADWEEASKAVEALGVRLCNPRIGVVLHTDGGMLQRLLPVFRAGLGGAIGSGKQWLSWIHLSDLVGMLYAMLTNESASGAFNCTAPMPVTNKTFSATLASVLSRPCLVTVPKFAVRTLLGEAGVILLEGQRAIPGRARELGYEYQFPTLQSALLDLLT